MHRILCQSHGYGVTQVSRRVSTFNVVCSQVAMRRVRITQYWHDSPPEDVANLVASFPTANPHMRHRVFDEQEAEAFIAAHFTPRETEAFRACGVPAMQADYFRYCAVLTLGGIYSDADFRCVGDLSPFVPPVGCGNLFSGPSGQILNGAFAFGSSAHPFLSLALEVATSNIERRIDGGVYFLTGPPIFSAIVWLHRHGRHAAFEDLAAEARSPDAARLVREYCEAIGSFDRVEQAMKGVRVLDFEEERYFSRPSGRLAYKDSETHWLKARGSPFK